MITKQDAVELFELIQGSKDFVVTFRYHDGIEKFVETVMKWEKDLGTRNNEQNQKPKTILQKRSAVEWFAELERIARQRYGLSDDWIWKQSEWVGNPGKEELKMTIGIAGDASNQVFAIFSPSDCDAARWEEKPC